MSGKEGPPPPKVHKAASSQVDCDALAAIFRESPAAMALWRGPEHVFEIVNPVYQAIFEGRELVGKTFAEALPEFAVDAYPKLLTTVLETGEPYTGLEVPARISRDEGRRSDDRYYDFTYHRINAARGRPYGVCVHAVDVTDRVLARRQLEQSEEATQARAARRPKGTWSFLAVRKQDSSATKKFRGISRRRRGRRRAGIDDRPNAFIRRS